MATAYADSCSVCTNEFNTSRRQSVSLPCGHDFCLSCLVRLQASGQRQCPTCRRNWAGFEVPALPGMEALAATLQADQEDEGDMVKKKVMFDICVQHSRHYEYWAIDIKEFYCAKCIAANPPTKLDLIEDVIPQIKAAIAADVLNAKKVANFLESLDEAHAELVEKRNNLREFIKAAQTLDDNFKQVVENLAFVRSEALNSASELNNMEGKLESFSTAGDINVAMECQSTLKKVAATSSDSYSDLPDTLLCNIACSYVGEATTVNPPSKASFVYAVQKYGTKPSPETVLAAEELKGGQDWTVDNNNCESALLALADRQPSYLSLVARDDACEALPVAAVARAAEGCQVVATFVDTFYSAVNTATDAERLKDLTANQSLLLTVFLGHLDHSAIAKLPHTITALGLAIGSAADAAAVSGLRPGEGLNDLHSPPTGREPLPPESLSPNAGHHLRDAAPPTLPSDGSPVQSQAGITEDGPDERWVVLAPTYVLWAKGVSVSSRVAAKDLKPLPSVEDKELLFPFLSDPGVDSVRPAIEALVPDLRISFLHFPKSQLTAAGASHLAQRLQGVKITGSVYIEASGTWQPEEGEKESVEAALCSATGCGGVWWDMDWIYC